MLKFFRTPYKSIALAKIGNIYYNGGYGVTKNFSKAKKYYKLSGENRNSFAYNFLGDAFYFGRCVEKNYRKAIKYYDLASKLGNVDAHYNIAFCYLTGQGVEINYTIAISYLKKISNVDIDTLKILGIIYEQGLGVSIDYCKAMTYFKNITKMNNGFEGFTLIGTMYFLGLGVEQSLFKGKNIL
ncbi:hypothetical protein M9Y10_034005 [Tritrichomonas musculus]|uniref:Uncharacterized protein n=1 Tax=Tritrichomonas musculus TaxID=1915356 RepID=A0ABR2KDR1_9EUKA